MVECPQCGGTGWVFVVEHGREFQDACYHCANTGRISHAQDRRNRIEGLAGRIAQVLVFRDREACNSNPDGEGWAFMAAENGMHESDYTTAAVWSATDRVLRAFERLDDDQVMSALLELTDDSVRPERPERKPTLADIEYLQEPDVPF